MAIIDCAIWKEKGNDLVLAYRYPQTNLSTYTQLIVYESQEALLFTKGRLLGKFGPGRHTLDTENLPLLRTLFNIPFGGKNPFTAEVWIINKLYPANLGWGVNNITIHDADYQTMIPLKVTGQYGVHVADAEKFMIKMVGTKEMFTDKDLFSQAYGEFASLSKSCIVDFMTRNNMGIKTVSAHLHDLSGFLKEQLKPFWQEYGLGMTKYYVTEAAVDTTDSVGRKVADAIACQASMSITGHSWQQEQMFGVAKSAVDNIGNSGNGLLASMMAVSMMGGGLGNALGTGVMQTHHSQPTFGGNSQNADSNHTERSEKEARMIYCANCSKKHLTTDLFCPHCGSQYHPCPRCGTDNLPAAKRCVSCGTELKGNNRSKCIACGSAIDAGAAFCPHCGGMQNPGGNRSVCQRCGNPLSPDAKFCSVCGNKNTNL